MIYTLDNIQGTIDQYPTNPDQIIFEFKQQLKKQAMVNISILFVVIPIIFLGIHHLIM